MGDDEHPATRKHGCVGRAGPYAGPSGRPASSLAHANQRRLSRRTQLACTPAGSCTQAGTKAAAPAAHMRSTARFRCSSAPSHLRGDSRTVAQSGSGRYLCSAQYSTPAGSLRCYKPGQPATQYIAGGAAPVRLQLLAPSAHTMPWPPGMKMASYLASSPSVMSLIDLVAFTRACASSAGRRAGAKDIQSYYVQRVAM